MNNYLKFLFVLAVSLLILLNYYGLYLLLSYNPLYVSIKQIYSKIEIYDKSTEE